MSILIYLGFKMHAKNEPEITIECDELTRKHEYWNMVLDVDQMIKKRFPGGAINRVDVVQSKNITKELQLAYFTIFQSLSNVMDSKKLSNDDRAKELADISQTLQYGDCGSLTNYALGYLKHKYPALKIECIFWNDHNQVLLGRKSDSNPKDYRTYGDNALIYDPWANKCYFAKDLNKVRQESTIHYYTETYDAITNEHIEIKQVQEHYLSGEAIVYDGPANARFELGIVEWVKLDQQRHAAPLFAAPLITLPSTGELNTQLIKHLLTKLSKVSGWKFNAKQATAWLDCNEQVAKEVQNHLLASKAMVVSRLYNTDTKMPAIKCTHFDVTTMQRLVNAMYASEANIIANASTIPIDVFKK